MIRYPRFLLTLLLAAGSLSCAESQDERAAGGGGEAAALARLDPGTLPALRDSFNAAEDRPRILVMLSPT